MTYPEYTWLAKIKRTKPASYKKLNGVQGSPNTVLGANA